MAIDDSLHDDELIVRHIPGGTTWQAPGPRITSKNFALRSDRTETGISVSRASLTSPEKLMAKLGNRKAGSRVAICSVGELRAIGLDVVAVPVDDDPGHAEIVSAQTSLDLQTVRRQLAAMFRFHETAVDMPSSSDES